MSEPGAKMKAVGRLIPSLGCHGRVVQNSELKEDDHRSVSSNGMFIWNGRGSCIGSFGKINRDLKRKGDTYRRLQGRVNHCSKPISYRGVMLNND